MTRERIHFEVALLASVLLHAATCEIVQHDEVLARIARRTPLVRLISALGARQASTITPDKRETEMQTLTFIEAPRTFMETTKEQVTGEEPTSAEFYSDKATVTANRENPTDKPGGTPYLSGSETRMASAADVIPFTGAVGQPVAQMPALAQNVVRPAPTELALPQPTVEAGLKVAEGKNQAMLVLPSDAVPLGPSTKPSAIATPPTVPEVSVLAQPPGTPGTASGHEIIAVKSRLTASGVARIGVDAFNVASSPFGAYDQKIIKAVQSRWYALIEKYSIYERSGAVTITFELRADGTVYNLQRSENSVGELLALYCEKAILDSTPFEPFPDRFRLLLGNQPREGSFTFYY
ncbi:MAG: hypothetical protein ABSC38_07015 [Verrucomicrobiia bacterium]